MIQYEYRNPLQQFEHVYWRRWSGAADGEELPAWFYTALDFVEVKCGPVVSTAKWTRAAIPRKT